MFCHFHPFSLNIHTTSSVHSCTTTLITCLQETDLSQAIITGAIIISAHPNIIHSIYNIFFFNKDLLSTSAGEHHTANTNNHMHAPCNTNPHKHTQAIKCENLKLNHKQSNFLSGGTVATSLLITGCLEWACVIVLVKEAISVRKITTELE